MFVMGSYIFRKKKVVAVNARKHSFGIVGHKALNALKMHATKGEHIIYGK